MAEMLPSPCISICQINPQSGMCVGCYRSRAEIASWPRMTADEQSILLAELRQRRNDVTGIKRRETRRSRSQK